MKKRLGLAAAAILALLATGLVPGRALAQAELAPEDAGLPPGRLISPPPPPPRVRVAADARLSTLIGGSRDVAPPLGWGFGLQLSASLLPLRALRFGFVVDYQQDRFTRMLALRSDQPQELIHNTFAVQALLDLPTRWLRPFVAAGVGGSVARHQPPQSDLVAETALIPLFRFSAGLGFSPLRWLELTVSADASLTVSDVKGGVTVTATDLAVASGPLFSPGWVSGVFSAGYRFY